MPSPVSSRCERIRAANALDHGPRAHPRTVSDEHEQNPRRLAAKRQRGNAATGFSSCRFEVVRTIDLAPRPTMISVVL
jgi:hypothetical protein